MKKLLTVLTLTVMLCIPTMSFAGDIPECLLNGENTQTFIGEVKEVTEDSVTFVQKYNFKGEFEEGREQTYSVSSFLLENIKVGQTVLCGYLDENNLYVYQIKSFKNNKIRLADDDYPMVKRLEEYINNGDFEKAEEERLANPSKQESEQEIEKPESQHKEEESATNPDSEGIIGGADGPTGIYIVSDETHYGLLLGVPILLIIAGVWFIKRRKK